jgi:phage gp37-like protein
MKAEKMVMHRYSYSTTLMIAMQQKRATKQTYSLQFVDRVAPIAKMQSREGECEERSRMMVVLVVSYGGQSDGENPCCS